MTARAHVWRQRLGLWLPALLFFLANVLALAFYRLNYAGESAGLALRLQEREEQLASLQEERRGREELLAQAEANRRQVEELYRERFATRRQRLTQVSEEVKSLARRAGLAPQTISYPEEVIEDFQLVQRSFVFTVQGNYQQLRTFINFLELSPSFLTLKEVTLSGTAAGPTNLSISLTLATFFATEEGEVPLGEVTS